MNPATQLDRWNRYYFMFYWRWDAETQKYIVVDDTEEQTDEREM